MKGMKKIAKRLFWRRHRAAAAAAAVLLASLCLMLTTQMPQVSSLKGRADLAPLTASILKVGKADAMVITHGDHTMVIDVGEEEDGAEVVEFLQKQGIQRVDVLIITHYDKDHVGGADTLVEEMEIGRVLLPDYEGASTEYLDFLTAMELKGIAAERLTEPVRFAFGQAEVLVEPPESYAVPAHGLEVDNNFSLITTITHGQNRLLFTGDIEKQRIREWLEAGAAPCDFLKVPHHGVYSTALAALLEALQPECAAICSSAKNPADAQTLALFKNRGIPVLETRNGRISVVSDGERIEMRQKQK